MLKELSIPIITIIASLGIVSTSYASEDNKEIIIVDKNNQEINVSIEPEIVNDVDDDLLQMIVDQSADLDETSEDITIHDVDLGVQDELDEDVISTFSTRVTKKFSARVNGPAKFLTSVAKGQTKSLGTTIKIENNKTYSATGGVSLPNGVSAEVSRSLTNSKTKTYSSTVKFSGPPNSSSKKSRQFYNTPFSDSGTWTAYYKPLIGKEKTYKGKYNQPSSQDPFVEWSRDI
ncbi:hypothetical protein [Shouchella miscanthi]|uniref:Uncharacterized protein n=1 Tax=Shouchella miscanthi TaxID=2598861 RepID=A0ABU6NR62_9BACI|nr:hypothetical protein [Shouchella miscanthi]MED4130677.1 hypothetical protein [Shouchella miscanthi]